jgi:hypothetical protein
MLDDSTIKAASKRSVFGRGVVAPEDQAIGVHHDGPRDAADHP